MWRSRLAVALGCWLAGTAAISAQQGVADGHVILAADHLPNADATELRARAFVERTWRPSGRLALKLSGFADGLLADRSGRTTDAVLRPHEAYVDVAAGPIDIRAGLATTVWGRLDEIQPSDVVNPLDVSRYLMNGRADARLPVAMARVRWFAGERATVEAVWVPLFRRGRFDRLDEPSSPFNLPADLLRCGPAESCLSIRFDRDEPPRTLAHSQGGARVSVTSGRVDWSLSAYRGLQPFGRFDPPVGLPVAGGGPLVVRERFPRYTMIGADLETARGDWAMRGEAALVVDDTVLLPNRIDGLEGRSLHLGAGADRRAGDYRLSGTLLVQQRTAPGFSDTNVSLVAGGERSFARETRRVRLFAVWNASDASGFARSMLTWSLRDEVSLEGSAGWFFGEGDDTLSRFADRDFLTVGLRLAF
jgi:hypothetical protein